MRRLPVLAACLLLGLVAGDLAAQTPAPRVITVISDLHLGVGRVGEDWHPFEDFRWAPEFEAFLEAVHQRGRGRATLVLNGDTFELWQSLAQLTPQPDCKYDDRRELGCQLTEAGVRLRRAIEQHKRELQAIGKFAARDDNRVVFVPGNHDAALLWKSLADEVVAATGASTDRVSVSTTGYWRSDDQRVFTEHGHEIGEDPNKFCQPPLLCAWPKPFLAGVTPSAEHLARPWGEAFVQSFYNQYEVKYPIIDNLASEVLGLRYGIAAEGGAGLTQGLGRFVRFLLTQESWSQFAQLLGGGDRPAEWDYSELEKIAPRAFLVQSLLPDDPLRAVLTTDPEPVPTLSRDEIRAVCERRETTRAQLAPEAREQVPACKRGLAALRAVKEYLLGARDKIFRTHLDAHRRMLGGNNFQVFVYSHTHKAETAFSPFVPKDPTALPPADGWYPLVVNSGAWQRVLTERQLKAKNLEPAAVLRLRPENLPACYSAIVIDEAKPNLDPVLRWWHRVGTGWDLSPPALAPECPETQAQQEGS